MLTPEETQALWLSLKVATCSTLLMLIPGIACAWLLARKNFYGKVVLDAAIHLPLVLPPVVIGYLLLLLLGRNGAIGNWLSEQLNIDIAFTWKATAIASAVMGFPLLVRSARLGMELIDRKLEETARTLGASPWRVFLTITLPLAIPGLLVGIVLAFARSLGEFGATITFAGNIEGETRTLPLAIYTAIQTPDGDAIATRLVIICIIVSLVSMIIAELLARRVAKRLGQQP